MVNANRVDSVVALSNNPTEAGLSAAVWPAEFVFCPTVSDGLSLILRTVTSGSCWFAVTGHKWESQLLSLNPLRLVSRHNH